MKHTTHSTHRVKATICFIASTRHRIELGLDLIVSGFPSYWWNTSELGQCSFYLKFEFVAVVMYSFITSNSFMCVWREIEKIWIHAFIYLFEFFFFNSFVPLFCFYQEFFFHFKLHSCDKRDNLTIFLWFEFNFDYVLLISLNFIRISLIFENSEILFEILDEKQTNQSNKIVVCLHFCNFFLLLSSCRLTI